MNFSHYSLNKDDINGPAQRTPARKRTNQKAVSILMDQDEEISHRFSKPFEFKLNPILTSAKENMQDSLTTIQDKNSVFGGFNFGSKDSDNDELVLNGEISPDFKKKKY